MIISHLSRTIVFILLQERKANAIENGDRVVIAPCQFCTAINMRTTTYFNLIILLPNRFPIRNELVAPFLEECRGSCYCVTQATCKIPLLPFVGWALNIS